MKKSLLVMVVLVGIGIAAGALVYWRCWVKVDRPRREALTALEQFRTALVGADAQVLLDKVAAPPAMEGRTATEQAEFIRKALRDEVSAEGIAALRRIGTYGPLEIVFPEEGGAWAKQAGVDPSKCVAFRAERNGIRAEVVLFEDGSSRRIVRINNVKQMAAP